MTVAVTVGGSVSFVVPPPARAVVVELVATCQRVSTAKRTTFAETQKLLGAVL